MGITESYSAMDPADNLYVAARKGIDVTDDGIEHDTGFVPFVVIGDYAYMPDTNGHLCMFPFTRRETDLQGDSLPLYKRVHWTQGVRITGKLVNDSAKDNFNQTPFPYSQVMSVLGRITNLSDIMDQHDINVMTG